MSLRNTTLLMGGHLREQSIMLAKVAFFVRGLDIVFRVSASTSKRNNVIEVQGMMRQDSLIADMTNHPIAFKDTLITDFSNSCVLFPGGTAFVSLKNIQSVGLPPRLVSRPNRFNVARIASVFALVCTVGMFCAIVSLSLLQLFNVASVICSFHLSYMLSIAIAPLTALLYNMDFLFRTTGGSSVSVILPFLFAVSSMIILPPWTVPLVVAIFTATSVSILARRRFREFYKQLLFGACSTHFRGKQGELDSVIQWGHSYVNLLLRFASLGLGRVTSTFLDHNNFPNYTINPLPMQLCTFFAMRKEVQLSL